MQLRYRQQVYGGGGCRRRVGAHPRRVLLVEQQLYAERRLIGQQLVVVGRLRQPQRHAQRQRIDAPARLPAGGHPAFKSVQSGMTVNYGGGGSGKGRTDLAAGTVNFAGSDSPIPDKETANFKGKTVLYYPDPDRPDHGLVQPVRRQQACSCRRDDDREHLLGQDQEVERPGDRGRQPRRHPAQHRDHHRRPLGLLGHHRRTSPSSSGRRRAAPGRSAPARPSSGPPTAQAGNGNAGVAQIVKSTPGAIGYVDYADAKASGLTFASVKNKAGKYVAPSVATSATAAADESPSSPT